MKMMKKKVSYNLKIKVLFGYLVQAQVHYVLLRF